MRHFTDPLNLSLFKLGTEDYDTRFEMDLENIEVFEKNLELLQKGPLYVRALDKIFYRIEGEYPFLLLNTSTFMRNTP